MLSYVVEIVRVVALSGAMSACGGEGVQADRTAQEKQAQTTSEVRLRKLHLVRPDLIQYPLAFETYC